MEVLFGKIIFHVCGMEEKKKKVISLGTLPENPVSARRVNT